MIAGPGIQVADEMQPVSLIDLYSTLTDLAFNIVSPHLDGTSFKNNLISSTRTHRYALSTWLEGGGLPNPGPQFSVRTENYRLIQFKSGEQELYNHKADRFEFTNLRSKVGGAQPSAANIEIANTLKRFLSTGTFAPRRGRLTSTARD